MAVVAILGACASQPNGGAGNAGTAPSQQTEAAPLAASCPSGLPEGARCLRGTDSAGAPYLIAMPRTWSGVLVVHAHGGPALGAPVAARADEDIQRWAITLKAGHAWAGSVFRKGGVAVRSAAEDTERVRQIFVRHVAQPRLTLLHGQSWGAGVAAKAAQMYAGPGMASPYAGVLLTSGVLAGGSRSYDFRLDLRVVYQHLCANHPRADEPQYPLWQGLPEGSALTRAQLDARVDQCLGLNLPAAQRSEAQRGKVKTIVDVIRIPESSIKAHLAWATWHFQDIAFRRTGGRNPFDNASVRYQGSADDAALNAGVLRYRADPDAARAFAQDTDPDGRIGVPVLTAHGIDDATAFVELESAFRETMQAAGRGDGLVQVFSAHRDHSYMSDATYLALFESLLDWVERGRKPTPADVAQRCRAHDPAPGQQCRIQPEYRSAPLSARVAPRR